MIVDGDCAFGQVTNTFAASPQLLKQMVGNIIPRTALCGNRLIEKKEHFCHQYDF